MLNFLIFNFFSFQTLITISAVIHKSVQVNIDLFFQMMNNYFIF